MALRQQKLLDTCRTERPSLRVFALGPLRVARETEQISNCAWVRKKSRTLFAYLLCVRPQGVHKEQLMELLWPGSDPARSSHALQVVLSDLRAALGNGESRRGGRPFICRVGDCYSLDVGPAGWVDAEAFEAECEAGRRAEASGEWAAALRHFGAADSLYAGDFLTEERFADWAGARRERLRDEYVDVLLRLVRYHERAGTLEAAGEYAKRVLAADPYLEPCYRDLMRYCAARGDHAGVARTYQRCQQAMRDGFDGEVSAETRVLAQSLLGARVAGAQLARRDAARSRRAGAEILALDQRPPQGRAGLR